MRAAILLCLLLLGFAPLVTPGTAHAQVPTASSLLGGHKSAAGKAGPAPGAAPAASPAPAPAIIPGSPLATITGATATPPDKPAAENTAAAVPFNSNHIGFMVSDVVGAHATAALQDFTSALRASTRFTPVTTWLAALYDSPTRSAAAMAILWALLIAVLPAVLFDALIRLLLRRPAARCAQWALPHREEFLPSTDHEEEAPPPVPEPERGPERKFISLRAWLRRLGFALLKFLLAMVPLAGFVVLAQVLLSTGFVTAHTARLAATVTANAYLAARFLQELARLFLSPAAPSLRLIAMPSSRARALMTWLLVLLTTLVVLGSLISAALFLGLPHAGRAVLLRVAALVVHLEAALFIWQSRFVVRRWIAGPARTGTLAWLRAWLGQWWHYIALFYVLALWVAWAGGVQNAFLLLLRSVAVLLAVSVVGNLAWRGTSALLERIFPDPATAKPGHPELLVRARVYNPFIRVLVRAIIVFGMVLLILEGWGLDAFGWLNGNRLSHALLSVISSVVITLIIALVLWELLNFTLNTRVKRLTAQGRVRPAARLRTLTPILRGTLGTVIFVVALLGGLSAIGVNTTGLLAVSSIVGIAVGFGSQKLVQDIITGLFMLLEDALQVGDVVTLAGMTGTVERLSIRTIHLRGGDGAINIIPFSSVTTITNATRDFSNAQLVITVGYGENIDHVCALLTDIGRDMRAEPAWGALIRDDLQIFGLDQFGEQGLVITGQIRTGPGQHHSVRREFNSRVQRRFAEENISIPFGQQRIFKLEVPPGELPGMSAAGDQP